MHRQATSLICRTPLFGGRSTGNEGAPFSVLETKSRRKGLKSICLQWALGGTILGSPRLRSNPQQQKQRRGRHVGESRGIGSKSPVCALSHASCYKERRGETGDPPSPTEHLPASRDCNLHFLFKAASDEIASRHNFERTTCLTCNDQFVG
jgi:hypothetical protein